MTATAYATTTDSMPGADAGITVFASGTDSDGYECDGPAIAIETCGTELDDADEPRELDQTAADEMLERMGFQPRGSWVASGGQWAVEVDSL